MSSPLNETREPEWKRAWTGNTFPAPPLPLLAIVGIVVFFLWVSSNLSNHNSAIQTATTDVNLFLLFLPLVLTLITKGTHLMLPKSSVTQLHDEEAESESESSSVPWGWIISVMMLLAVISYRLHPLLVVAIVFLYVYLLSA